MADPRSDTRSTAVVWAMRVAVVASGAVAPLIDGAMDSWSDTARAVMLSAAWLTWAGCLLCVLVPSSISLTALRLTVPVGAILSMIVAIREESASAAIATAICVAATFLALSADVGDSFVQVSAYGDERRHVLRCPPAMIFIQLLAWIMWMSSTVLVATFAIDRNWIPTFVLAVVLGALSWLLPRRFHRYSRRWLVQVPAGLVIHDHVVLAETAMFLARDVRSVDAVTVGTTDAADLTGGCRGTALRITLDDFETVVMSATRNEPGGRAIHVKSMLVCPSRPGRTLGELTTPPPSTTSPASS